MSQAIAAMLTPAVGVAVSPFPVMGLVLILLGRKSRLNSVFFTIGWMFGNCLVFVIALLFMSGVMVFSDQSSSTALWAHLLIAGLLLFFAVRSFRYIPKAGQEARTPRWFEKLNDIGPWGSLALSIVLSVLNPLDMALSLNAGVSVGALDLTIQQNIYATILFVLMASSTVILPTVAFLFAGKRLDAPLHNFYHWLIQHNAIIMAVLFLMLALENVTKALRLT